MEKKLTLEQQKLVEDNFNLIYGACKKYNINFEECYDIMAIGLCKAARIYNKNKGKFSTIAYAYMLQEYRNYLRLLYTNKNKINQEAISFGCGGHYSKEGTNVFLEMEKGEIDMNIANVENTLLEDLKPELTDMQYKVLQLFALEYKPMEIAQELKCTSQNVYRIREAIKKKIKQMRKEGRI